MFKVEESTTRMHLPFFVYFLEHNFSHAVSVKTVAAAYGERSREGDDPVDEPGLDAYTSAFCRICRCYGCLAHSAVSVK